MNEGMVDNFTPKLVAMATFLERSEKRVSWFIYDQIPSIWWKPDDNWSRRSWHNWSSRNH